MRFERLSGFRRRPDRPVSRRSDDNWRSVLGTLGWVRVQGFDECCRRGHGICSNWTVLQGSQGNAWTQYRSPSDERLAPARWHRRDVLWTLPVPARGLALSDTSLWYVDRLCRRRG
jgi:hypothetical protein